MDLANAKSGTGGKIPGLLRRRGVLPAEVSPALIELAGCSPTLAGLQAASIQGRRMTPPEAAGRERFSDGRAARRRSR
jgi:hypothetical protein